MRTRQPFYLNKAGMLATLIAAAFTPYAFALTPAGKIDFAFGTATATGTDGVIRPLKKGTEIYSGDAITTTDGRVQIRFSDGAYLALQPNTLFKVDQYAYEGKSDGKEKGSFSLVKGGLRTITGAIGKVNKQNYEVRTPTATIGIRGTGYSAEADDNGTTVSVYTGLVSVSNQGGSVTIGGGQSVHVRTPQSSPEMTDQKAAADQIVAERKQQEELEQQTQTERPLDTQPLFTAGDQRTSSGESVTYSELLKNPVDGPGYSIVEAYGTGYGNLYHATNTTANFSGNALTAYVWGDDGEGSYFSYNGTIAEAKWDGLIGWGRWVRSSGSEGGEGPALAALVALPTYESHDHYVFGKATSQSAITALNGTTVNFALLGATSAVSSLGFGGGEAFVASSGSGSGLASLGTFTGSAAVHFGSNTYMDLTTNISDSFYGNFNATFNNMQLRSHAGSGGPIATFYTNGEGSVSSSFIELNGLFAGSNAERMGIAYSIDQGNGVTTTGAAAFTSTSRGPSP